MEKDVSTCPLKSIGATELHKILSFIPNDKLI